MSHPGRVILLDGASSSGKSSLGEGLQRVLPEPWFLFSVDALGAMRSATRTSQLDDHALATVLERTRRGFHRAVAGLAAAGNDVIADYPLSEPWRCLDLVDVLTGIDVTLIGVRCSLDELERRERARGDRPIGLARSQVAGFGVDDHDVVVDTTHRSPAECAEDVRTALLGLRGPKAFDRLRTAPRGLEQAPRG